MKKLFITLVLLTQMLSVKAQSQYELNGAVVPRTIDFNNQKLQLNGFGTRSKMWVEVYVQALYVLKFSQDPKEIIDADLTMAVRIQITSGMVTSKKLTKSLQKGLEKAVGEEGMKKIESETAQLERLLSIEDTKVGDAFNLVYNPDDKTIWVLKNDVLRGKIKGFEFKKALFGIWLSDHPVDEDLKKALLGY